MKTVHLSDNEIQQYTFDLVNCGDTIIEHINSCDMCKNVSENYRLLSKAIKEQPEPQVAFNLADLVLDKLPSPIAQKTTKDYSISFSIIISIGIVLMMVYALKSSLINLIDIKNITTYFIISIGVFVTALWSIDMVKSYNRKMNTINFY